ncbi:annexin-2 receptor [Ovis aries]|uniref:annexin-2 receptor n=1 Tax=Ovis aries TaxID=9940 RepID=UPI001C2EADB8|nr:annexin-2 receptor [Ovis aries]
MEHFPRCVHAAWGSSKEPQETEVLQLLSLADPGEWQLPCFPTLGERSSNKENFSRKQLSTPCGLLRPYCPKHGPGRRATAGREPGGQLWTPSPRPAGSRRRSQKGKTPARPQSFPGRILPQREDLTSETRPLTPGTVPEHRPPPDLGRHHRESQEW